MNKSIRNIVFFVGIFLLITGGLSAQTELRFDTWVSGNIRSGVEQRYSVRPTQAATVVVETSGNLDTYLRAYDASDNIIAEDDDSGEGYNARLEIFVQPGRTYFFVVSDYYGDGGSYQIRASQRPLPQATELRLDNIVSGNIREGESYWYRVRASQAGFLVVETSGSTDTYLEAYDESYNLLGRDDDGGDNYNARLSIFAEAGRNYLFRLRGYSNSESGPYRAWATIEPVPVATELRLDTMVSGNLRGGDEYWYSVRASQVGFLAVETSGSTDTYLEAYDSSYKLITTNDDGGEGGNAKIEMMVSAGTTYLFKLRGYSTSTTGSYRIWASSRPIPAATELRIDAIVSGNISEGQDYWYSVRATENGYITVGTMGNTDTYLEAYDSSYRSLGSDDDSGGNGNAELEIQVQAGQTYLFRLTGYGGYASGPYRIWANFNRSRSSGYYY
jgi:hypothetical protein